MNGFGKIVILAGLVGFVAYLSVNCCSCIFGTPSKPVFDNETWWGPGEAEIQSDDIHLTNIDISDEVIKDLNNQLDRYLRDGATPPLENQGFEYGFNTNYLREVVTYWRHKYSWKARQEYLNKYPHYQTSLNGLNVHFMMVKPEKSAGKRILPLLMLHGWPGSFREFYDVIPLLTTPKQGSDFVFEVIVPSLPGYGFSSGASKPGLGPAEMAVIMKNLMTRLGYEKFYVQGGDWGSLIANNLAILYPESILGIHSNFCTSNSFLSSIKWFFTSFLPSLILEGKSNTCPIKHTIHMILRESGYFHLAATRPDTIGTALNDSPVGLAAYILEKFSVWTNSSWMNLPDGGLTKKFTLDALLDNIMIYWVSGTITTSVRLYAESFTPSNRDMLPFSVEVPAACARFPNELLTFSNCHLEGKYKNLLQISDLKEGGHFAAFEVPQLLSEDVWSAVTKFEDFHSKRT